MEVSASPEMPLAFHPPGFRSRAPASNVFVRAERAMYAKSVINMYKATVTHLVTYGHARWDLYKSMKFF